MDPSEFEVPQARSRAVALACAGRGLRLTALSSPSPVPVQLQGLAGTLDLLLGPAGHRAHTGTGRKASAIPPRPDRRPLAYSCHKHCIVWRCFLGPQSLVQGTPPRPAVKPSGEKARQGVQHQRPHGHGPKHFRQKKVSPTGPGRNPRPAPGPCRPPRPVQQQGPARPGRLLGPRDQCGLPHSGSTCAPQRCLVLSEAPGPGWRGHRPL